MIEPTLYSDAGPARRTTVALGIILVFAAGTVSRAGPGDEEPADIEAIEEQTEAFANALLELSVAVRARDMERVGPHFARQIHGSLFPREPGELRPGVKWIHHRDWPIAKEPRTFPRQELTASLRAFLGHFSSIEDARFKVKSSAVRVREAIIEGGIALWLVARDEQGRREWVRGRARVSAHRGTEGRWRITHFKLESLGSMVCTRELFNEVAHPAGLSAKAPLFLERSDPRFAAYGVAVADVDNDGLLDIYASGPQANFLYLNRGDGTFENAAAAAFVDSSLHPGTAPLFLDFDNDGDQDLFVSTIGEQVLLENRLVPDGRLGFSDVSGSAGVAHDAIGFSAVAGDINMDGHTDIYVACYNRYGEILPNRWDGATNGTPNLLFLNRGDGTFREAAAEWGVADPRWSYAAQLVDIDTDGDLDLYVANDYGGGNALYINKGTRFEDVAIERGVVDRGYGMGVSFGDYDNDGDLDLHVTRMSSTAGKRILARLSAKNMPRKGRLENMAAGNALYENLGGASFREVSEAAGPFSGGWAWGGGFFDLDNDGWQDLYTPNGFISGKTLKDT